MPAFQPQSIYNRNVAASDRYIIEPTSIHIVIQQILNKSGRTAVYNLYNRENRLCPCGLMQTEQHIIEKCNPLSSFRVCYPGITFIIDILLNMAEPDMFKVIYDMLNYFS